MIDPTNFTNTNNTPPPQIDEIKKIVKNEISRERQEILEF
jgi:hypothetical protein